MSPGHPGKPRRLLERPRCHDLSLPCIEMRLLSLTPGPQRSSPKFERPAATSADPEKRSCSTANLALRQKKYTSSFLVFATGFYSNVVCNKTLCILRQVETRFAYIFQFEMGMNCFSFKQYSQKVLPELPKRSQNVSKVPPGAPRRRPERPHKPPERPRSVPDTPKWPKCNK